MIIQDRQYSLFDHERRCFLLPPLGQVAAFIDDEWMYLATESTEQHGYFWLQRWCNNAVCAPCDIFRRPMSERGLNIFLRKWKVIDESWELLGEHDINADVIELMGKNAEREFVRKTWPVKVNAANE